MTSVSPPRLADERFVSLTTFRASGAPVATPVWIADLDGDLVVLTPRDTGKVKRLRRDPRIELRPCDRRGRVEDGVTRETAVAELIEDPHQVELVRGVMRRKYGVEYRVFMVIEALLRRTRHTERVGLRIRPGEGA